MIALLVFITLTLVMVAPFFLLKPSPLTAREVARINECNAWVAETKAKLDATQAKADALTAKAAVPAVPAVPAVHYTVSSMFFTDVPYTAIEWVAIEGEELGFFIPRRNTMYQVVTRTPMGAINKANSLEGRGFIVTMEAHGDLIISATRIKAVRHVA